jgi:hypothetical protein
VIGEASYVYQGAVIDCLKGGHVRRLLLPEHPLAGMSFGVAGTITPLVDLWLDEGRLPSYMRASPKAGTMGMSWVACSRVQAISVPTAIHLAGTDNTFGDLRRRLPCVNCGTPMSMVACSDSRPASTRDRDGPCPETLRR